MNTKNINLLNLIESIDTTSGGVPLSVQYSLKLQLCTAFAEAALRAHAFHSLDESITQFKFNRKFNFSSDKRWNAFETEYAVVGTKCSDNSLNRWDLQLRKNDIVLLEHTYQE